jgi:hypothetical protein
MSAVIGTMLIGSKVLLAQVSRHTAQGIAETRMTTKLMVSVAFGGGLGDPEFTNDLERDFELDPDLAADELRQAGYEVFSMPDKYGALLTHPLDNFIEAVISAPNDVKVIDAIMDEVDAIVGKYGGTCFGCGPIGRDHIPFADLFKDIPAAEMSWPVRGHIPRR